MLGAPMDPRIRMRDALRDLIAENPRGWEQPSLLVVRNRLLDRTGMDARPFAELLLEADRRGWRDRLPAGTVDTARWHTLIASFAMQWSTERFVQPEMARWALETWGYAMRVIDASQLTIAPPPRPEAMATTPAVATRSKPPMAATVQPVAPLPRTAGRPGAPSSTTPRPMPAVGAGGRVLPRSRASGSVTPPTARPAASGVSGKPSALPGPELLTTMIGGTLLFITLMVVGRVAFESTANAPAPAEAVEQSASAGVDPATRGDSVRLAKDRDAVVDRAISPAARALRTPVVRPEEGTQWAPPSLPSSAPAPASSGPDDIGAGRMVAPSLTGGIAIVASARPGVPSITGNAIPSVADTGRMMFVQPARRAGGESRAVRSPTASVALTYDELRLMNGTVMRGRVDVVQSGSVIFREQRSGLRYAIRKDEIDQIISEFGTPVRFRATTPRTEPARDGTGAGSAGSARVSTNGVRDRGVAGRYRIRYAAASAIGSPECRQVWSKPPNTEDVAIVRHVAGADTLNLAFDGGDNFPSNIDGDGYFASTFRIVPDQARTMTALTTRLNGQFTPDGALRFTVNIVFFRRMRTGGDITCNVEINADGRRF